MKTDTVYGPGCNRSAATSAMVKAAAGKLGLAVAVEKVTDAKSIAVAGVMSMPAMAVDGKLVHAGGLPASGTLQGWLSA